MRAWNEPRLSWSHCTASMAERAPPLPLARGLHLLMPSINMRDIHVTCNYPLCTESGSLQGSVWISNLSSNRKLISQVASCTITFKNKTHDELTKLKDLVVPVLQVQSSLPSYHHYFQCQESFDPQIMVLVLQQEQSYNSVVEESSVLLLECFSNRILCLISHHLQELVIRMTLQSTHRFHLICHC